MAVGADRREDGSDDIAAVLASLTKSLSDFLHIDAIAVAVLAQHLCHVFGLANGRPVNYRVGTTPASTHRFFHERADFYLFGGIQLLECEAGRPHGAFVEVRLMHEAKRRIPRFELGRTLEKADDLAVLGIRGHPVPESRREGGALALMMAWSRSPRARSGAGIAAICASTALSPSALSRAGRAAAAFSSWARSFIAARSSSVNPSSFLSTAVGLLADFCLPFAWAGLPGPLFSDMSVSFLAAFRCRTTPFTRRAGCKKRDVSDNRSADPVKCNAGLAASDRGGQRIRYTGPVPAKIQGQVVRPLN